MAAHLYWSINITATRAAANYARIAEIEMFSLASVDLCVGGTATASSSYPTHSPDLAFNDITTDYWLSGTDVMPQRITYHFLSAVSIDAYSIRTFVDGYFDSNPADWTLDYSDDGGTTWTTADTRAGYVLGDGVFLYNVNPVVLTAVDITSTASNSTATAYRTIALTAVDIASTASNSTGNANTAQTLTAVDIASTASSSAAQVNITRILSVIDSVAITSASTENITATRHLVPVDSSTVASSSTANVSLTVFLVPVDSVATHENVSTYAVFLAINYALDNKAVTTYSNFNFTGSCRFAGKTLFINGAGLFEYGGLTDNGAAIVPSLKTGKMCEIMGRTGLVRSNNMKRIPASRISLSCDKTGGSIDLNVMEDNAVQAYNKAIIHDGYATYDIPIGRGTKYNFIQMEFKAHDCVSLDIDAIEFNPVELRRRER